MKTLTKELWLEVPQRRAIVSIHNDVERLVAESGVRDGLVLANAMHITASVFINDNESGLHADYERWLEELVPFNQGSDPASGGYLHNRTGEDNADAHHKRQRPTAWVPGAARSSSPSPTANSTLVRRSIFSITSSTAGGGSGCW